MPTARNKAELTMRVISMSKLIIKAHDPNSGYLKLARFTVVLTDKQKWLAGKHRNQERADEVARRLEQYWGKPLHWPKLLLDGKTILASVEVPVPKDLPAGTYTLATEFQ